MTKNFESAVEATLDVRRNGRWWAAGARAVPTQDPNLMRFYPDINAVLGGKSLTDYVAAGGARSLFLIDDQN